MKQEGIPTSPSVSPMEPWQWDVQSYQSLHLQNCISWTPRNGTVKRLWKTLNLPIFSRIPRSWYVFIYCPKVKAHRVLPHGDQVSYIDTTSYGSSHLWSVSILGVIPKWKSTARLPKHMINLQIATNSRTLTTFSPENKNSACPKSIPIPRPPSHPLQSFRVSARSNPTIPEVGQASALLPQSFAEPHGSSHCGHWQNCSSALWRKARTWNTWNMGEAIHFVATDFLLIGILII